ncbi:MAG TPA: [FeFe] hydrogenase, group A [Candidatus Evtepia faecavium]|nr:[FeFe] hydrogenase, group A [Candidatus Evtepia faecavium]
MVTLTIDNHTVSVPNGTTILEAARKVGVKIPTLCYLPKINEVASCRVCAVEVEGVDKLATACNTQVVEGMVVHTNTQRVRITRKTNVELILSQHVDHCVTCVRSGNCSLQSLSKAMNIQSVPFRKEAPERPWDPALPILRDSAKCIKCLRCVSVCERVQSLGVWEVTGSGAHTTVRIRGGLPMNEANCALCGQCVSHCPVGALRERDDTEAVFSALADPTKEVVFQIAPAVRSAWGEILGLSPDQATEKRLAAAVRALGVRYVFDTTFSADLTILEESHEFLQRLADPQAKLPQFTSCCPGWVRFVRTEYPEMAEHLSTAKSPQQMFGAVAKSYFAEKLGKAPEDIFCVSVMPCTAKKYEAAVPEVSDAAGRDVDVVLTTRELDRMLRAMQVNVAALPEEDFDHPLGRGSGAGVIFGVTGGVMEAALRTAYWKLTGENPAPDAFEEIRGQQPWREVSFTIGDRELRLAVASGLGAARELMDALRAGQARYDFVEVMACPGGCSGGGGQPIHDGEDYAPRRGQVLYQLDRESPVRFSHENPEIQTLYQDYLGQPLSEKAEALLHTDQRKWTL